MCMLCITGLPEHLQLLLTSLGTAGAQSLSGLLEYILILANIKPLTAQAGTRAAAATVTGWEPGQAGAAGQCHF